MGSTADEWELYPSANTTVNIILEFMWLAWHTISWELRRLYVNLYRGCDRYVDKHV